MSQTKISRRMYFGRYDYATFSTFVFYAACSTAIPIVLVDLAQSLGFPLEDNGKGLAGTLQLARSIPMVISLIFCGIVANYWGKFKTIGISVLLLTIGMLFSSIATSYWILMFAAIILGFGEGTIEGLSTPVVQDLHEDDEPSRYITFSHSFWSVGVLLSVIFIGALLTLGVSWRIIIATLGILSLIPAFLFLLPTKKYKHLKHKEVVSWQVMLSRTKEILFVRRFWLFVAAMFFAGGGEFSLTFWIASFIQLNHQASALLGGIATGVFALGMIVSRMSCGFLIKQERLKELIVSFGIAGILIVSFLPFISSLFWVIFLLFFAGIASAPFWPSIQSYCVDRVKGDSTLIFIILSASGIPGCGFFTWIMGVLGDKFSLEISFLVIPLCYLFMSILIGYDWYDSRRKKI